jgi:diguanylate cyclase (GGDEF)-like protein
MLSRLWASIRYSIAAKLYLHSGISVVAIAVLVTASVHFAGQTRFAAHELYREGVVGIQAVTQLEVLFEQHRALITAAPAELDRHRLQNTMQAVEVVNSLIDKSVHAEPSASNAAERGVLAEIAVQAPKLREAGDRVLMFAGNFIQDRALEVSQGDYAEAADAIRRNLQAWSQAQIRAVDREVDRLSEASSDLILWVIASAFVAFVLIGPVGLWTKHRVLSRLGKITAVMHRLCSNELFVDIPYTEALDEMGDIARTIEVFKGNAIALGLTHLQLDAALNNMVQGLCMFDAEHRLVLCNDRYLEMFGVSRESVVSGIGVLELVQQVVSAGEFVAGAAEKMQQDYRARVFINGTDSYQQEFPDGRTIAVSRRELPGGGWVDTHEDITERRKAEKKIAYMAEYDALTDLPNRNLFQRTLTEALQTAADADQLAIFCMDLDGFKGVNDTFGHAIGDELLRQVSRRLEDCVGDRGMVARLGGDEFAILQWGRAQPDGATTLAVMATEALNAPYDLGGNRASVGASIGIAIYPCDASTSDELLKCADMALYGAKANGRGTCRFFEPEMNARVKARRRLEIDLRAAIADKQFEMFYQPVVSVESNEVIAFEALIRWRHPDRGMVSPAEFIPVAEETGLIIPLGEWILRQVCDDALRWPQHIRVAVNTWKTRAGNHRDRLASRQRGRSREAASTEKLRRADLDGRFRHRIFQSELSAQLPVRQDQDRPELRSRPRQPRGLAGDHPRGDKPRKKSRNDDYRRRRRDPQSAQRVAAGTLRRSTGVPVQPGGTFAGNPRVTRDDPVGGKYRRLNRRRSSRAAGYRGVPGSIDSAYARAGAQQLWHHGVPAHSRTLTDSDFHRQLILKGDSCVNRGGRHVYV